MHLIQVQIMEELNVKKVEVISEESELFQRAMEAEDSRAETMVQIDSHSVALDGGYMVAVDIAITAELLEEGIARELVHRIQNLRRAAGFELTDRIVTFFRGPEEVARVMGSFGQYIKQETLSEDLVLGEPIEGSHSEMSKIEGSELVLGVKRL